MPLANVPILVLSFGLMCIVTPESCTVQRATPTDSVRVGAAVDAAVDMAVGAAVEVGRPVGRSSVGGAGLGTSDLTRLGVETIGVLSRTGNSVNTTVGESTMAMAVGIVPNSPVDLAKI